MRQGGSYRAKFECTKESCQDIQRNLGCRNLQVSRTVKVNLSLIMNTNQTGNEIILNQLVQENPRGFKRIPAYLLKTSFNVELFGLQNPANHNRPESARINDHFAICGRRFTSNMVALIIQLDTSQNLKEFQRISKNFKEFQRISKNLKERLRMNESPWLLNPVEAQKNEAAGKIIFRN